MPIESASSSATGAKLLACIDRPWKLQEKLSRMETKRRLHDDLTTTWRRLEWKFDGVCQIVDDLTSETAIVCRISIVSILLFCGQETHSMRSHHHGRHGRHGRVIRLFAIAKTFRMHWPLHCRRPGKRKTILIDIVSQTDAHVQIWSAMCVCVFKKWESPKFIKQIQKVHFNGINERVVGHPEPSLNRHPIPNHPITIPNRAPGCASAIDSSAPRDVRLGSNSDPSPRRSTESYRRCCWSLAAPG